MGGKWGATVEVEHRLPHSLGIEACIQLPRVSIQYRKHSQADCLEGCERFTRPTPGVGENGRPIMFNQVL